MISPTRRSARLVETVSTFNPSVTLFHLKQKSPRPTKRVKAEDSDHDFPAIPKAKRAKSASPAKPKTSDRQAMSASPKKVKLVPQALSEPHPTPEHWRQTYDIITEMRIHGVAKNAPVDTMGCQQAQIQETDPKNRRFSTLISLMLSTQTSDQVTDAAVKKLRAAIGGTLSLDALLAADQAAVSVAINKVGFHDKKAIYIIKAAQMLRDCFDSEIPKTVDELCTLPGVGPKVAFLTLQVAWSQNHGIAVDTHVHRITNRLGWHTPPTNVAGGGGVEKTRLNLQSWLPNAHYQDINHMLVGFGQTICKSIGPKCGDCKLSTAGLCPSAQELKPNKSKRKKAGPKIVIELEE